MTEETHRIHYQYPFHSNESKKIANSNPRGDYYAFGHTPGDLIDAFGHTPGDLIDERDLV